MFHCAKMWVIFEASSSICLLLWLHRSRTFRAGSNKAALSRLEVLGKVENFSSVVNASFFVAVTV